MRHPEGLTLYQLPDGRTLVRDDNVPPENAARFRWQVLRAGWQQTVRDWAGEVTSYLGWWSAVVMSGCVERIDAEEMARLVGRVVRDG